MSEHQSTTSLPQVVSINDVEIQKLTYKDKPVVTFQMIADVHGIGLDNVRKAFYRHRERFVEGRHYAKMPTDTGVTLSHSSNDAANEVLAFTEKGYLLLVKPMRDDTSWQVQERMIDDYFRLRDNKESILENHEDLTLMHKSLVAIAEMRELQKATEQKAIQAMQLAQKAFAAQQTMTLRYYRYANELTHQVSDTILVDFSRHLMGYCLEHGVPVSKEQVADRKWGYENRYPVSIIEELLPDWLARYHSQQDLSETN